MKRTLIAQPLTQDARIYRSACELLRRQCDTSILGDVAAGLRSRGGHPYILAGAVRDALHASLTGTPRPPRDYDIGATGIQRSDFDSFFRAMGARSNRYGGYEFESECGLKFDIWRIEETVGVVANGSRPTLTNVLRSFVIDINAVAFDPYQNLISDFGCLNALKTQRIGLVRAALFHQNSNFAGRAISLEGRLGFRLTPALAAFVLTWRNENDTQQQLNKLKQAYSGACRPASAEADSTPELVVWPA